MLEVIGDYPFDLFKIKMTHLSQLIMAEDIEKFATYLDKRCIIPEFLAGVTIGKIKNN